MSTEEAERLQAARDRVLDAAAALRDCPDDADYDEEYEPLYQAHEEAKQALLKLSAEISGIV